MKHREEQVLDLQRRNIEDEKRIFGDENLTATEKRIFELKQQLLMLAERRRDTGPEFKLYSMPGADLDEDDGDKKSREQRLREKLEARYTGD